MVTKYLTSFKRLPEGYWAELKRRPPQRGDTRHLDEVLLKRNGVQYCLCRAVDQPGVMIALLVQPHRDRWAALRFFYKLLCSTKRKPQVIMTDKLHSDGAAKKVILPRVTPRQSR